LNCFLSKWEKQEKIDDLADIEILHKGRIRRSGDYTRYFIRFVFKSKNKICFGETLSFLTAQSKVNKNLFYDD
jgi:hypothetical protein